ncbi:run domain Beclin-1-interacting and cysteine-rich domain-containing protein [Contarinia nasturtii]|uniref:run domain Beclin-1-interacting and cysteine-rich domain-containing protein n=1 Tax=Contarinia nasturtii TaxID=265458 RepID=UPI0012D38F6A|nr:run domain Beclin-1-interacting and cysteine-rich domain-containing protein [Contarinia nasturtii]
MNSMPSSAARLIVPNATKKQITKFEEAEHIHRQLLYDLMSSIYEYILILTSQAKINYETVAETGHRTSETPHTSTDNRLTSNVESLLLHIHSCLEQIFLNGLRIFKPDKSPDLWRFFEALNWINPHMTVSIGSQAFSSTSTVKRVQAPKSSRIRNDKALMWLYENLLTHQLKSKLKCILSDHEHLTNCFEVTLAFFGSKKFVEALYICLNAFDKKQYDILLQIDQNLYLSVINESIKNSTSITLTTTTTTKTTNDKMSKHNSEISKETSEFCDSKYTSKSSLKKCDDFVSHFTNKLITNRKSRSVRSHCKIKHCISLKLRKFVSLPDLSRQSKVGIRNIVRTRSQTIRIKSHRLKLTAENLAINDRQKITEFKIDKRKISSSSARFDQLNAIAVDDLQPINLVKCDDIKIYTDRRSENSTSSLQEYNKPTKTIGLVKSNNLLPYLNTSHASSTVSNSPGKKLASNSAPGDFASFFAANGAKIENRYHHNTIFDNIESSTSSPLCNHDQCANLIPNRGQSLTSYLQEAQRTRRNITDLERENAHFTLSDAIISAIEEIKCSRMERKIEKQHKATIKAKIKKRKSHQRPMKNWIFGDEENCDKNNITATDDDTSSYLSLSEGDEKLLSSSESDSNISSSSDTTTASNVGDLKRLKIFSVSSHSINDHSAFAEWAESSIETLTAEGIALSLISKFKDYQLPRAADLLLNTTDSDVRSLLDATSNGKHHQIPYQRGTEQWAPPRPQIIFTRHPVPDRRSLLEQQNQRCAGCGMFIDKEFLYSLRYCEYTAKYHCTGCHRNQISAIPARVLDRWDFSCHPVSVFSYRLLDQIWKVPLFRLPDLNKELYGRVRALRYCRLRRLQLKYVYDFIQTCRFADDDKNKIEFDSVPSYIYDDHDNWSMNDFVNVRNGSFASKINSIILKGEEHVFNCELCTAHGFICEYCADKQVIFPWQLKVTRCVKCGSCSHTSCSKDHQCLKCQRLEKRKKN